MLNKAIIKAADKIASQKWIPKWTREKVAEIAISLTIFVESTFNKAATYVAGDAIVESVSEGTGNYRPSVNTKVNTLPETKAPNAMRPSDVVDAWNDYLGQNQTNINPRTGLVDNNRIFSADGTKSIRFGNHEMGSLGTPKGHFHFETWTYDPVNDVMTISNILQRIIP